MQKAVKNDIDKMLPVKPLKLDVRLNKIIQHRKRNDYTLV
jgi:hypothetical protein